MHQNLGITKESKIRLTADLKFEEKKAAIATFRRWFHTLFQIISDMTQISYLKAIIE